MIKKFQKNLKTHPVKLQHHRCKGHGVWVGSGSWWWTGKPGMLQSTGSQSQTRLSNWTDWMKLHMYVTTTLKYLKVTSSTSDCTILGLGWGFLFSLYFIWMVASGDVQCNGTMPCAMLSNFSPVWLFATSWTVTCQAPLSMGFYRQEY